MPRRKVESAASGAAGIATGALEIDLQLSGRISIAPLRPARLRKIVSTTLDMATRADKCKQRLNMLTLRFVIREEARQLNTAYRASDYAPNVLTFAYPDMSAADIVICPPVVREQANTQQKRYADHLSHMVVHGVLHALGYTHERPTNAARMERLEKTILAKFKIGDPYILGDSARLAG
ncbi:MAG: rRNA maturation RNase YbeY [Burkholderiaceae bacterium]